MALRRIVFQLDYLLNAQFSGLVTAASRGVYRSANLSVEFTEAWTNVARWDTQGAGQEPDIVAAASAAETDPATSHLGCVELNVLMEARARGVPVRAVAPMLGSSALALGMRPGADASGIAALRGKRIGMHADSLHLLSALANAHADLQMEIVRVDAADKYRRLLDGDVDAIQIYDVTEPLELDRLCGSASAVLRLAPHVYDSPGYSQVMFAAEPPADAGAAEVEADALKRFVEATREGWRLALEDPERAAQQIMAARKGTGTYSKSGEQDSVEVQAAIIERLRPYVAGGPSIDRAVWDSAEARLQSLGVLQGGSCGAAALHPVASTV
uniref:Thiamine pyrimidine synthase n=1 Tax=Eutreptiella gymnastica TaxID=73025 RepID=A0A7S4G7M0_9EUGL